MDTIFDKTKHINFMNAFIYYGLNEETIFLDSSRMTLVYFIVSSFDVLNGFKKIKKWSKKKLIKTIYSYQAESDDNKMGKWGFISSFTSGINNDFNLNHLALTYCAINSLIICGDDLKKLNKKSILKGLSTYQLKDGSFLSSPDGENDMRFVYCAASICHILNDWSTINKQKMIEFIMSCFTYEGGFSQNSGNEAHGGPTFCAVASLKLAGELDNYLTNEKKEKLIRWCLKKQNLGFEGRPNKVSDTCYTFWIGATLEILGKHHLINHDRLIEFCLNNQDKEIGGFCKQNDCSPDILHTYLTISGLSLLDGNPFNLRKVVPELNMSDKSYNFLKKLHATTLKKKAEFVA